MVFFLEVTGHPLPEIPGFPDIENGPAGIRKQVTAGCVGDFQEIDHVLY
jgi:hypothetical protein